MDIRQIRLFLAVIDHRSFTRAAKAQYISQPAVSQAIRSLEEELGTHLFTRLGRSVEATSAGTALAVHARSILREMEAARRAVDQSLGLLRGTLEMTALRTLAETTVAELIGDFRLHHPEVVVHLAAPESPDHLLEQIRSGVAELGVTDAAFPAPNLLSYEIKEEEFCIVYPISYSPLPDPIAIEEIADLPLVVTPTGTSSRVLLDEAMAKVGVNGRIGVVSTQREALVPLVLAGAGVALVPSDLGATARKMGAMCSSVAPRITRRVSIVHRNHPLTPAAQVFLETVLRARPTP